MCVVVWLTDGDKEDDDADGGCNKEGGSRYMLNGSCQRPHTSYIRGQPSKSSHCMRIVPSLACIGVKLKVENRCPSKIQRVGNNPKIER